MAAAGPPWFHAGRIRPAASVWVARPTPSTQRGQSPSGASAGKGAPHLGQVRKGGGGVGVVGVTGGTARGEFCCLANSHSPQSTTAITPAPSNMRLHKMSMISPPPRLNNPSIALFIHLLLQEAGRRVTECGLHALSAANRAFNSSSTSPGWATVFATSARSSSRYRCRNRCAATFTAPSLKPSRAASSR